MQEIQSELESLRFDVRCVDMISREVCSLASSPSPSPSPKIHAGHQSVKNVCEPMKSKRFAAVSLFTSSFVSSQMLQLHIAEGFKDSIT